MSTEENKALVRRYVEAIHGGSLDEGEELIGPDFAFHVSGTPGSLNREAFGQLFTGLLTAFPDLAITNEELIAEGDKVVGRWITRGTHQGELWGIPPTGNQVTITSMDINRIADGRIAERWHEYDALGMMQQLGVIPAPGSPASKLDNGDASRTTEEARPTSSEENKALVLRFISAQDRGDIARLGQLMAPDFRMYLPTSPEPINGEGAKQFFAMFHAAFPDSSHTIEDQIAEGELVAARASLRGTHRGEFQGIPPTGNQVTITGIGIHRTVDGRIAEHWPQPDLLGLMQQIGAVPAPQPTA